MIEEITKMFSEEKIDLSFLADKFPKEAAYFTQVTLAGINRYDNGVMSVTLEGTGGKLPSTFGYLPVGEFEFNVGKNEETMHFLLGKLTWGVKGRDLGEPKSSDFLVIPTGETLILKVTEPTFYICDYEPKS